MISLSRGIAGFFKKIGFAAVDFAAGKELPVCTVKKGGKTPPDIQISDSIDKPSSVAYDHLSSPAVADGIKPPFNEARRADALPSAPIGVASDRVYMAAQSPALR